MCVMIIVILRQKDRCFSSVQFQSRSYVIFNISCLFNIYTDEWEYSVSLQQSSWCQVFSLRPSQRLELTQHWKNTWSNHEWKSCFFHNSFPTFSLGKQWLTTLAVRINFLMFKWNFLHFNLRPFLLNHSLTAINENLDPFFFSLPLSDMHTHC